MDIDDIKTVLKEHTDQDRDAFNKLDARHAKLDARLDVVDGKIDEIQITLSKQKGFFAGVVFVVSSIAAVIAIVITWFKS